MKNWLVFLISGAVLYGCSSKTGSQKIKDSVAKQKVIDSMMALGNRPDSDQEGPTYDEVLKETLESYNKIKKTDTVILDGRDSLKIHFKYYCLHDSTLIIPAKYDWSGKPKKDFTTNNFAAKIVILKNRDTVFNNVVLKSWFGKITDDNWKRYVTVASAGFNKYDRKNKHLTFGFSVSIPTTDLGFAAKLLIDKNGGYEITK